MQTPTADVAADRAAPFAFDNSYARLPERFYARVQPTRPPAPRLLLLNADLARELGADPALLASEQGARWLSGAELPPGAEPLAMAYAGHQFGHFVPQLGDGRAILLGEVIDRAGVRQDLQLKGAGRTPFSRMGDGLAALGPVLREFIVSEAMHAMGVPTTRALAAAATGAVVRRERPLPGAVLTRVAEGHVRVGTFQFFAAQGDHEAVRTLLDHVVARNFPHLAQAPNRARAALDEAVARQARLVAQWMALGFIHGVMNTDNMHVGGQTIDYGPCAFMDGFRADRVFSSIDHAGRYAWNQQPRAAHWNLSRLAGALARSIDPDEDRAIASAQEAIDAFPDLFAAAWREAFAPKLGLDAAAPEAEALIDGALRLLGGEETDFTLFFRRLCLAAEGDAAPVRALFRDPRPLDDWLGRWRAALEAGRVAPAEAARRMRAANPAVIPRNHRVEQAIAAAEAGDLAPAERLIAALRRPFDEPAPEHADLAAPPAPAEEVRVTYCGT